MSYTFSHGTSLCGWFSHGGYGLYPKVKNNTEHLCVYICPFLPHSAQCLFFIKKQATLCVCMLMPSIRLGGFARETSCHNSCSMFFLGTDHIATTTSNFRKKREQKVFGVNLTFKPYRIRTSQKRKNTELSLLFTVDAQSKPTESPLTQCETL